MMTSTFQPDYPSGVRLTKRETEILSLVAQGLTGHEIAERLFVTTRTVDFHLANVYKKLGVHSRLQAVRAAVGLGLMPSVPIAPEAP